MGLDRIKAIKEKAMCIVEQGLNQDVSNINSQELYEAMDVLKDAFETCKLYHEAEYYEKISKAMDESVEEDKTMKMMEKYLPEMSYARNYTPYMRNEYPVKYYTVGNGGRPMRNYSRISGVNENGGNMADETYRRNYMPHYEEMPYYEVPHDTKYDGESWKYRRNYMENKKNGTTSNKDLEEYAKSLTEDVMEMVENMEPEDKMNLRQKIVTLANKLS